MSIKLISQLLITFQNVPIYFTHPLVLKSPHRHTAQDIGKGGHINLFQS